MAEAGRDALTEAPNLQVLASALGTVEEPVIASGGVRDLQDLRRLLQLEASGRTINGVIVGREVTAGRFTVQEAKEVLAGGGPTRAPGGVTATRTSVGVSSLDASLEFYTKVLGFEHVRSTSGGVAGAVVEAGPGHHLELVEGASGRPEALSLEIEEIERWKAHFATNGVASEATENGLQVSDPDGLTIELETS